MDRKEFVKTSCQFCLFGISMVPVLAGCGFTSGLVYKTNVLNNRVEVPLQLFEKGNFQVIRPKGWQYDIAVRKNENGAYQALLMQCTHMDNQLTTAGNGFVCNLHGSEFNSNGAVIKGPAERELRKYPTELTNTTLIIHL